jgi:hypothetical protein
LHGLTGALALTLGLASRGLAQDVLPAMSPNAADVRAATQLIHSGTVGTAATTATAATAAQASEGPKELPPPQKVEAPADAPAASCSSCGAGGRQGGPGCGCVPYPCGYQGCFPGHQNCCGSCGGCGGCGACNAEGPFGKFFCCFYQCLCCPDPCYEPCYRPEANSAFFVDGARPVTMSRIRWDDARNFTQPDRSEYFWARSGGGGKGVGAIAQTLNYDSLTLYQEVATKKASFFVEQDYRTIDPIGDPLASGFGDMNLGTKALLFDCELLQVTFQFRTFLPIGNFNKGLGTGHVSLEPSILCCVKLLPETFLQTQLSEWIPIAGDPSYAGSILHYHFAVNHVLWRPLPDVPFIGGVELNAWSFQDGQFSDPIRGQFQQSSGGSWLSIGPSLRIAICTKIDFGFAAQWSLASGGPEQVYRTEVRFRF